MVKKRCGCQQVRLILVKMVKASPKTNNCEIQIYFHYYYKQTQEKKSTLRCALSLLFYHGEKLDTTQRGAAQGGFLLLGLFIYFCSFSEPM